MTSCALRRICSYLWAKLLNVYKLEYLNVAEALAHLDELKALLLDAVESGASIGFLDNVSEEDIERYWLEQIAELPESRYLFVAKDEKGDLHGAAQLALGTKANGMHRAEVQKVLVHSSARRKGLGRRLMEELESVAAELDIRLLVLDTIKFEAAEKMYPKLGYVRAGELPDFALMPDGEARATVLFYKQLET